MANRSGKYKGDRGLEYYRAYPRDFFEGCIGMPGPLRGFYRMVIDLIYMHDGFLLNDFHHISGLTGFGITQCKRMLLDLMQREKIYLQSKDGAYLDSISPINEGYFTNKRAKSELKTSRKFQEKQANNATQRWNNKDLGEDVGQDWQSQEVSPHKTTRPQDKSPSDSRHTQNCTSDFLHVQEKFDQFWKEYPHRGGAKKGEAACRAEFEKLDDPDLVIAGAIEFQRDRQAVDGFAVDPLRWLQKKCWLDDIEISDKPPELTSDEKDAARRTYLERTADRMEKTAGGFVIGSRLVDDRDLRSMHQLGIGLEKLNGA